MTIMRRRGEGCNKGRGWEGTGVGKGKEGRGGEGCKEGNGGEVYVCVFLRVGGGV